MRASDERTANWCAEREAEEALQRTKRLAGRLSMLFGPAKASGILVLPAALVMIEHLGAEEAAAYFRDVADTIAATKRAPPACNPQPSRKLN